MPAGELRLVAPIQTRERLAFATLEDPGLVGCRRAALTEQAERLVEGAGDGKCLAVLEQLDRMRRTLSQAGDDLLVARIALQGGNIGRGHRDHHERQREREATTHARADLDV